MSTMSLFRHRRMRNRRAALQGSMLKSIGQEREARPVALVKSSSANRRPHHPTEPECESSCASQPHVTSAKVFVFSGAVESYNSLHFDQFTLQPFPLNKVIDLRDEVSQNRLNLPNIPSLSDAFTSSSAKLNPLRSYTGQQCDT